jgi:hypothetical protein
VEIKRLANIIRRSQSPYKLSVYELLRERAVADSADYAQLHLDEAMIFENVIGLWGYSVTRAPKGDGLLLEFGVFKGKSINYFSEQFDGAPFHGFDSFEGLAEDWTGYHLPKGTFDVGGRLPPVPNSVTLHKGWFDKTLPNFLDENPGPVRFCHIDCDTYESSLYVLKLLSPRLVAGSIIVFDEYFGYPNWRAGEYKAWQEVCAENEIRYRYVAFANMQVSVEIV